MHEYLWHSSRGKDRSAIGENVINGKSSGNQSWLFVGLRITGILTPPNQDDKENLWNSSNTGKATFVTLET